MEWEAMWAGRMPGASEMSKDVQRSTGRARLLLGFYRSQPDGLTWIPGHGADVERRRLPPES